MKKNYSIQVPVTSEEKRKIETKARSLGMTTATFLRYIALRGKIKSSIEII